MTRKITNRSGFRKVIGKFPSLKTGRTVMWESQIERDFIYLLEFDPDVRFFKEQPIKIKYKYKNKPRKYTPDFYVERRTARELVEVKPASKVKKPDNILRFLAGAEYCKNAGYVFKVVTDEQIRDGSLLANIKLLHRYATVNVPAEFCQQAIEIIQSSGEICLEKLITILKENSGHDAISNIYALLYYQILVADLREPLSGQTIIKTMKSEGDD
ncbi:MAG: TnsA endonuclease N-terminal domain-containing protein [Candidatus Methanoperedens sp.]|nr:TnsA endonuclease N-terminal domain-containing protein [Candidatus Methanoperedens sp.]